MTVLVSLDDVSAWVGYAPKVVLTFLRLAGIPLISDKDECGIGGEYFLEVDLDFVEKVGLPIDMDLIFNQRINTYKQP